MKNRSHIIHFFVDEWVTAGLDDGEFKDYYPLILREIEKKLGKGGVIETFKKSGWIPPSEGRAKDE